MDGNAGAELGPLVRAAAAGDAAAWEAIVDRFASLPWSVARAHRLSEADAADVVQNTWLRLLEHLGRINEPAALPGWIATVARREAYAVLRRQKRQRTSSVDDLASTLADTEAPDLDASLLASERSALLWHSFRALPERCQKLLRLLMVVDRPDYTEVSAVLGMPVGSIGPTRGRCLAKLRDTMEQDPRAVPSEGEASS